MSGIEDKIRDLIKEAGKEKRLGDKRAEQFYNQFANYLPLDGSEAMTGALDMDNNAIYGDSEASGTLYLRSTSHATKGDVQIEHALRYIIRCVQDGFLDYNTGDAANTLKIRRGSAFTPVMEFTSAGLVKFEDKVGVGMTPAEEFDIKKDQNEKTRCRITNVNAGDTSRAGFVASSENANLYMEAFASGVVAPYGDSTMLYTSGAYPLILGTAGVQRMRITPAGYIYLYYIRSGATQAAAGASANELWKTNGHATLPDNVVMIGV